MQSSHRTTVFLCANLALGIAAACGWRGGSSTAADARIVATFPVDGATDVSQHHVIIAFSRDMDAESLTLDDRFYVEAPSGRVEGSVYYDRATRRGIWTPKVQLEPFTDHQAVLDPGLRATAGGSIGGYRWNFRTGAAPGWTTPHALGDGEALSVATAGPGAPGIVFGGRGDAAWLTQLGTDGRWRTPEVVTANPVDDAKLTFGLEGDPAVLFRKFRDAGIQLTRRSRAGVWSKPRRVGHGVITSALQDTQGRVLYSVYHHGGGAGYVVTPYGSTGTPLLQHVRFGVGIGPGRTAQAICYGISSRRYLGQTYHFIDQGHYGLSASGRWKTYDPLELTERTPLLNVESAFRRDGTAVMAIVHEDRFVSTWRQYLRVATLNREGKWLQSGSIITAPPNKPLRFDLADSSNGADLLAWTAPDRLMAALRPLEDLSWPEIQMEEWTAGTDYPAFTTAVTGDKRGFVAWVRTRPDEDPKLFVRRHDSDAGWTPAQLVVRDARLEASGLKLVGDGIGGVVLTWSIGGKVFASRWDSSLQGPIDRVPTRR